MRLRNQDHLRAQKQLAIKVVMTGYRYPAMVIFDLDYTLWPFWCDYHIDPPVSKGTGAKLRDSSGFEIHLFKDVESIILELHQKGVKIIGASRTPTPHIAKNILSLLEIEGHPMSHYFDSLQWGEGSKVRHITNAVHELGMRAELENGSAILFDDEWRNKDVEKINCNFAFIENYRAGLTREIFEAAMREWSGKWGDRC